MSAARAARRWCHAPALLLSALLATPIIGCTYDNDLDRAGAAPPGTFELTGSAPPAGATAVPRQQPIVLQFNRPPNAASAVAVRLRLFAGVIESIGSIRVDLVDQSITFTPTAPLRNNLRHRFLVHEDLRGIDGARLGTRVVFDFTTGAALGPLPAPRAEPTTDEVQLIWDRHACASCHGAPLPASGLDMSTADASRAALRRHSVAFPGHPLVDPYHHARSYLMLKLLGRGGIVGYPMPPAGDLLAEEELRTVADWIDAGAGL